MEQTCAVVVLLVKPEHKRYPEIYGVYTDAKQLLQDALGFMDIGYDDDFDPERPWTDNLTGQPVTKERILNWEFAPGDMEGFEFERDGTLVVAQLHEVCNPTPDEDETYASETQASKR